MKKKLIIFSSILILMSVLFISGFTPENAGSNSSAARRLFTSPTTNGFLIGALHSYWDMFPVNRGNYDAAGLNISHSYTDVDSNQIPGDLTRHTPISHVTGEHLFDPVNVSGITAAIQTINSHNQSRFFWQRPKIEWLCYGQSSVYQAEQVSPDDDHWFYSFNVSAGESINDYTWNGGKKVLHCSDAVLRPGAEIVLKGLKANTEQCRTETGSSNQWMADNECTWLVKPRIRIDSNFAANNPNTNICKIIILNQNFDTVKNLTIKASNFSDGTTPYNGQYLEEFFFGQNDSNLTFHGALGTHWGINARGTYPADTAANKADIQIYWYDNCEMWIDYVKVENDVASDLLSNDPNNAWHQTYDQWITEEVNAVKDYPNSSYPAVFNFYIELFEFNNIPCMAYVNHKIDSLSNHTIGLMADQLTFYENHMAWADRGNIVTPDKLKRMFFNVTGFHQIFVGDPYPLTASHPNNGCSFDCKYGNPQYSEIPSSQIMSR